MQIIFKVPDKTSRHLSLDIARGFAIFAMVESHVHELMVGAVWGLGTFAAPFFLIIAGVSYELFLSSRKERGTGKTDLFLETVYRAIVLFLVTTLIAFILETLIPSLGYSFKFLYWSVFQVIAVGYILGFILRSMITKLLAIIAIFLLNTLIKSFDISALSFLNTGVFPLLPWLAYFTFGQIAYGIYSTLRPINNKLLLVFSALSIILVIILSLVFKFNLKTAQRDTIATFVIICSIQFIILSLLVYVVDRKGFYLRLLIPLEKIGKIAFSSYYIHLAIIYLILKLLPSYDTVRYIDLILIFTISLGLWGLEKIWRKFNYMLGVEWLMRVLSRLLFTFFKKLVVRTS